MTPKMTVRFHEINEIERIAPKQREEIIELYLKNEKTLRVISEQFDCSIATIRKVLRRGNIEILKTRIL